MVKKNVQRSHLMIFCSYYLKKDKRIVGIPTQIIYGEYLMWCAEHDVKSPYPKNAFTRYACEGFDVMVTRRRINGKVTSVFWDSGATRLDLGDYLD